MWSRSSVALCVLLAACGGSGQLRSTSSPPGDPDVGSSSSTAGDPTVPVDSGGSEPSPSDTADPTAPVDSTPAGVDSGPAADTTDTGDGPVARQPDLDPADVTLFINLGDSVAAGYDAAGEYGYARLLHANDDGLAPGYAGADLVSLAPSVQLLNLAESGADSGDILGNLRGASLPPTSGEVVVTISAGGNDFNDDPAIMLATPLTRAVATQLRANLAAMVAELRSAYGDPHIYVLDIQDPTDGTGEIPPQYDDGMCGVIQAVPGPLASLGVANLGIVNQAIADEAAAQGVELVSYHDHFLGHGLTSSDGWMSGDCAHPTSLGHHHLRALIWWHWTNEWR